MRLEAFAIERAIATDPDLSSVRPEGAPRLSPLRQYDGGVLYKSPGRSFLEAPLLFFIFTLFILYFFSLFLHRVLLVAPLWRNQHWFAGLSRLLTAAPWPIPLRRDLLSQANRMIWHPQPVLWALHLWPLNGSLRTFPRVC